MMNTVRKLSYRSDLGELRRISRDVSAYCHEYAIDPDTTLALTLCLNELFTNTLKYGYRSIAPTDTQTPPADRDLGADAVASVDKNPDRPASEATSNRADSEAAGGSAGRKTWHTPDRVINTQLGGIKSGETGLAEQLVDAIVNFLVEIYLERHDDRVLVRYCDRGQPFDPFINPQPLPDMQVGEPETLLTGGFGIHLLRQLCSEARYAREGENNVISLTFVWGE